MHPWSREAFRRVLVEALAAYCRSHGQRVSSDEKAGCEFAEWRCTVQHLGQDIAARSWNAFSGSLLALT